jgi:glycosyltransferase involved in cell wall biosynthesis
MGVDTRTLFTPAPSIPRATNEILFVGRLVEKKGCAYLLEAMPEILDHYPDARLSIVGDGPMETALKRQAKHLGIAHAVTFVGAVNNADIPELHRRASVLVVPSIITVQGDQEGLGLVMVEALACECPVVASDLPAIRDVIAHENTGLLVQPKNPGAIAGAVVRLFEEPKLGRQLAVNGRNHVTQIFDWAVIGDHYTTLIEKLALGHS